MKKLIAPEKQNAVAVAVVIRASRRSQRSGASPATGISTRPVNQISIAPEVAGVS